MSEQPSAGRWWRFSIRELLLLTAAVAAFLAWAGLLFQRSRPFTRTAIPDKIGNVQAMRDACQTIGHPLRSYSSGGGGSSDMHATTRTFDSNLDLPAELRGAFMTAFRKQVFAILVKEADRVYGEGTSRDGQGLRGFELTYEKGSAHGRVIVRTQTGEKELSVLVFVHEYDTRR